MPENTLYSKYEPCVFGELQIKGESWSCDFLTTSGLSSSVKCSGSDEFFELLERAKNTSESLAMDFDSEGRDGCFNKDQLFAVWENNDIESLIKRLNLCRIHRQNMTNEVE